MGLQSSHILSFTTKLFNFLIMNHQISLKNVDLNLEISIMKLGGPQKISHLKWVLQPLYVENHWFRGRLCNETLKWGLQMVVVAWTGGPDSKVIINSGLTFWFSLYIFYVFKVRFNRTDFYVQTEAKQTEPNRPLNRTEPNQTKIFNNGS